MRTTFLLFRKNKASPIDISDKSKANNRKRLGFMILDCSTLRGILFAPKFFLFCEIHSLFFFLRIT